MSKLYGTLYGDGRAQNKTRCARNDVNAAAQSWEGSVISHIRVDSNGSHFASIEVANGSATGGRIVWSGPLSLLVNCERLELVGDRRNEQRQSA